MPSGGRSTAKPASEGSVLLSPARTGDAAALAQMSRHVIEHGLGWRWRPAALVSEIRDPDAIVLLARAGRTRVGFAAMRFDFDRAAAHLVLLAVAPQHRRRGTGRALLAWLEAVARRGGIETLTLEVRDTAVDAQRFYRALGFAELERLRGYYDGREDALRMGKRL